MTNMIVGPPPSVTALIRFDADWHGRAHRNVCVRLRDGRVTIKVAGTPDFEPYYAPLPYTEFSWSSETGEILIETPSDPDFTGVACLGIGE